MARRVEDLALVLPIISGPDGRDPFIAPVPLARPEGVELGALRGAFYTDNGIQAPVPEVASAGRAAVEALERAGIDFEEKRPPGIEETMDLYPKLFRGWDGGAWVHGLLEAAGTAVEETTLGHFLDAPCAGPGEVIRLFERWDRFRVHLLEFLTPYDIIVTPVNAYPAIEHGESRTLYAAFSYAMTFNLTGWPAAVVRVAESPAGLPIGCRSSRRLA